MPVSRLRKIPFDELYSSTTMFYVNTSYEEDIEAEVQRKVAEISLDLQAINSKDSLRAYIVGNADALDNLTSLMEISTERFKRMVSMIRKDRGFVFQTEWGLGKIRKAMMESPAMMESILNLIWAGRDDEQLKKKIPFFYLDNMIINESTMRKLTDKDSIRLFVKRGMEGRYSNNIGDLVLREIEQKIQTVCAKHGLSYQTNVRIPLLDRSVSFVLEDALNPKIIIDVSYSVTTSSSQSSRKEAARKTVEALTAHYSSDKKPVFVNFLDGAGWIGRQADMQEIHRCSDYVLNFNNIGLLEDIVDAHIDLF